MLGQKLSGQLVWEREASALYITASDTDQEITIERVDTGISQKHNKVSYRSPAEL